MEEEVIQGVKRCGRDLKVGDTIAFLGRWYVIDGFDDHPGHDGEPARIARSGAWGMTVFDGDFYDVMGNVPDPKAEEFARFLEDLL